MKDWTSGGNDAMPPNVKIHRLDNLGIYMDCEEHVRNTAYAGLTIKTDVSTHLPRKHSSISLGSKNIKKQSPTKIPDGFKKHPIHYVSDKIYPPLELEKKLEPTDYQVHKNFMSTE